MCFQSTLIWNTCPSNNLNIYERYIWDRLPILLKAFAIFTITIATTVDLIVSRIGQNGLPVPVTVRLN